MDTYKPALEQIAGAYTTTLSLAPGARVNEAQKSLIERLGHFDAPYLEEKLMKEGAFDSKEGYDHAFTEFKKYTALVAISGKRLGMPSKVVDSVWHQFILFTPKYMEFCNDFVGRYMHHVPDTSLTPTTKEQTREFVSLYRDTFGELPKIWGNHPAAKVATASALDGGDCSGGCSGCGGSGCGGGGSCGSCGSCGGCSG